MRFIGDIHDKASSYVAIIEESEYPTVQIGDYAAGFNAIRDEHKMSAMVAASGKHRFIRGNHDSPEVCKQHPYWIEDGTIENNIMYVGGAWSIDWYRRTNGIDWWDDEELSIAEWGQVIETYAVMKPEIMVTHDCPSSVSKELFIGAGKALGSREIPTRTGQALQSMFELHQPKLWIFGHWHFNEMRVMDGTKFICIGELSDIVVDTDTCKVVEGFRNNEYYV